MSPVGPLLNWGEDFSGTRALHNEMGAARQIAAACSLLILANSLSGLAGQVMKRHGTALLSVAVPYWPLPLAGLIGGQAGSWLAGHALKPMAIKRLNAILIL